MKLFVLNFGEFFWFLVFFLMAALLAILTDATSFKCQ